jgi:hypothetical protein
MSRESCDRNREQRGVELYEAIAAYGAEMAGTTADFDPELAAAALELLSGEDWDAAVQ